MPSQTLLIPFKIYGDVMDEVKEVKDRLTRVEKLQGEELSRFMADSRN